MALAVPTPKPSGVRLGQTGRLVLALPKTIGLADEFEQVGVMGEAVEQRSREALITEDLRPVGKTQIGGDSHRHPLVQRGADWLPRSLRPFISMPRQCAITMKTNNCESMER